MAIAASLPAPATSATPRPAGASSSARTGAVSDVVAKIDPAARREDWRWLDRYPDDASHRKAEAAQLQVVIGHLRQSNERLAQLIEERKPLDIEAAFYKVPPPSLQLKLDASDGKFIALRDVFRLLEQDVDFIVARYGNERSHLRPLWAGAAPGSIGFLKPFSAPSR